MSSSRTVVAASADVAGTAELASGVRIWDLSHVGSDAVVGCDSTIGRGATIGAGARIGARCKVQNGALVYGPADVGDGVFVGPGAILTNDRTPRAVNPDGTVKTASDWLAVGVTVDDGASIGAGAVCVAPVRIGRWAGVAAGAVVTRDVPDHALVAGVPAVRVGWVGCAGERLFEDADGTWWCPSTGERYCLRADGDGLEAAS